MAKKQKQKANPPRPTPSRPPLSRRKRFVFSIVALALPFVLLALVEGVLRLKGFGGYPAMFRRIGPVAGGDLVIADQGGAVSWFFANPTRAGLNEFHAFVDPKPTNMMRIFCVGESAMQGYPQPRHLAASSFLQAALEEAWPTRRVEVINLGTTAIASYPVLGIMTEALEYQPDLVIVYTGNNEFFGTYGVASVGRAGSKPWMLKAHRFLHSLAVMQALDHWLSPGDKNVDRTLMERMMAETYIGPEDWRRPAAANNLYHNISEMIQRCRARGVPVLVCSLPANERDLAPIGTDKLDALPAPVQAEVTALFSQAETRLRDHNLPGTVEALERLLKLFPHHARAHFLLAKCLAQQGKATEALTHYTAARDSDTMPWRPPAASQEAVVRAARDQNAPICDLLQAFRSASPGGTIGWEMMDDHVHPTLRGQTLIAGTILDAFTNFGAAFQVPAEARNNLNAWTNYALRLGDNIYDHYAVAHNLRLLFNAPFMRAHNLQAYERYHGLATMIEKRLSEPTRAVLQEWQETRPFAGSRCPVTAAVAQLELKNDSYRNALNLYEIARNAVPEYTSWHLEYTYYVLYCKQKLRGSLDDADRALAQTALQQGRFLVQHQNDSDGFTERYTGLLHLLRGEFADAIPFLAAGRQKVTGFDRLAVDQTLLFCYAQTRQLEKARALITEGAVGGGEYAAQYRDLLEKLPALEQSLAQATNAEPTQVPQR
jgi:lysophospholipase L1-like esterase